MKPLAFASTIVSLALLAIFGSFHKARPKATTESGAANLADLADDGLAFLGDQ